MKGINSHKLRSGALQFTVFISVLIALLLGGLILYAYTFNYFKEQSRATIGIIQLADAGINYALDVKDAPIDTLAITNLENQNQKVKIQIAPWGIFEKAIAITQHRKKKFKKIAIIAGEFESETSPTLYLQESYNPLTLVGNTKIKGNAFLPSQGVKPGYIAGQSYYGTQLIYGKVEKSGLRLPEVNPKTRTYIEDLTNNNQSFEEQNILLAPNKKVINFFKNKTKYLYSTNDIVLNQMEIIGNVIIKSNTKIIVTKATNLRDIILIAPEIEIQDYTAGTFQAIATKKITLGNQCKLNYPSALALWDNPKMSINQDTDNGIFIAKESQIKGVVCYFNDNKNTSDFNAKIILEEKAKIKGQVYCQGSFELKGIVSGAVYAREFVANQAGSMFINHIYNGMIENKNIPQKYGGVLLENSPKMVAKWLY